MNRIKRGLYVPESINVIPEIVLINWKVFEVTSDRWEGKSRHFVGWNLTENSGRVSSDIITFDETSMIGITRSGRRYLLQENPGNDIEADYVWRKWCDIMEISVTEDVTEEYVRR